MKPIQDKDINGKVVCKICQYVTKIGTKRAHLSVTKTSICHENVLTNYRKSVNENIFM